MSIECIKRCQSMIGHRSAKFEECEGESLIESVHEGACNKIMCEHKHGKKKER